MTHRRFVHWLMIVALSVASVGSAAAHPLATTTVALSITDADVLNLSIEADAEPLVAKLEVLAGMPASGVTTRDGCRMRLRRLVATLLSHIELRSDGAALVPSLRDINVDETKHAEIQFVATLPRQASTVTWRSEFVFGSYPIVVRTADGHERVEWLQGPQSSPPFALSSSHASPGFFRGLAMGFTHIVPAGLDHILFVLGLYLLSRRAREVLMQVSAFTVAHSVTLGLSLYGLISAPASIVEPMIALSVAYVGVENLMTSRLRPWRVALVFAFGLLHGMGFAEALAGLHLSASSFVTTLVSFNVGVEAGQLAVIAAAACCLALVTRVRGVASVPVARIASAGIGFAGMLWTIERLM